MTRAPVLTAAAALSSATVGGVFLTFSTFTMRGLTRLSAAQGIAAMQSINVTAVRPPLMTALFGTGAACAVLAVRDLWGEARSPLLGAGSALYLAGAVGVTLAANVPLNNALAAVDPAGDAAIGAWQHYVRRWTRWNHVRTVSCLGAAAALLAAAAQA